MDVDTRGQHRIAVPGRLATSLPRKTKERLIPVKPNGFIVNVRPRGVKSPRMSSLNSRKIHQG
jgi:hypothetical protein